MTDPKQSKPLPKLNPFASEFIPGQVSIPLFISFISSTVLIETLLFKVIFSFNLNQQLTLEKSNLLMIERKKFEDSFTEFFFNVFLVF